MLTIPLNNHNNTLIMNRVLPNSFRSFTPASARSVLHCGKAASVVVYHDHCGEQFTSFHHPIMSRPMFNRPVEYDPSLLRQQQQLYAQQQIMSRPVSREQAMKNEFGFDAEEEKTGGGDIGGDEQSVSRINRVDDDDAAADEEELERLAEQVQAAREAQMVNTHKTTPL